MGNKSKETEFELLKINSILEGLEFRIRASEHSIAMGMLESSFDDFEEDTYKGSMFNKSEIIKLRDFLNEMDLEDEIQ